MLGFVPWIAFCVSFMLCGVKATNQNVEECLMYRVDSQSPSPVYVVKENQETLLSIFDYFDDGSSTRILDGDSCILLLSENGAPNTYPDCHKTINSQRGYFKVVIKRRGKETEIKVEREGGVQFYNVSQGFPKSVKSVRVETDSQNGTAVVFGCSNGCFELEDAIFYHDFKFYETMKIFGRKIDEEGEVEASVKFTTHLTMPLYDYLLGPWTEMSKLLSHDCWYNVDLTAKYTSHPQLSSIIELFGSFQSFTSEPRYLAYTAIDDSNSYVLLDFVHCKGIRWRVCDTTDSLPQCQNKDATSQQNAGISMLYFYITLPVWALLMILIVAVTVTTYRLRLFGKKKDNAADYVYDDVAGPAYPGVRVPDITQRQNPAFISSEEEDHIYEEVPDIFFNNRKEPLYLQPV